MSAREAQVPQVIGHVSLTPPNAQRELVLFLATHEQLRVMYMSSFNALNLIVLSEHGSNDWKVDEPRNFRSSP